MCTTHYSLNAAAYAKQRAETLNTTVRNTETQIALQQKNTGKISPQLEQVQGSPAKHANIDKN